MDRRGIIWLEHKVAVRALGRWLPAIVTGSRRPSSWASPRIAPKGKHLLEVA